MILLIKINDNFNVICGMGLVPLKWNHIVIFHPLLG
jgi:hypothetical protein